MPFLSSCFQDFSLLKIVLSFQSLTVMYLVVYFFGPIVWSSLNSWIYQLMFSWHIREIFRHYFIEYFFSDTTFLLSSHDSYDKNVTFFVKVPPVLVSFIQSIFFLLFSWLISIVLSFSSLIISSVLSILLLRPFTEFLNFSYFNF